MQARCSYCRLYGCAEHPVRARIPAAPWVKRGNPRVGVHLRNLHPQDCSSTEGNFTFPLRLSPHGGSPADYGGSPAGYGGFTRLCVRPSKPATAGTCCTYVTAAGGRRNRCRQRLPIRDAPN